MSESINDFPHIDYGGTQCLFSLYEQDLLLCCVSLFLSFPSPSNLLFCQIQSSVMPPLAPVKLTQPDTYTRLCHHPQKNLIQPTTGGYYIMPSARCLLSPAAQHKNHRALLNGQ